MEIIKMPKVGNTVETCLISAWNVKEGDFVNKGDLLFSFETDKTQIEQKSEVSGYVLKLLYEVGDEVPVFAVVALIGKLGEDISNYENKTLEVNLNDSQPLIENQVVQNNNDNENLSSQQFFASPRAINLAQDLNVNLSDIKKTSGVNNRIISNDVEKYYNEQADSVTQFSKEENNLSLTENKNKTNFTPVTKTIAYSQVRKVIKKQMTLSLSQASQVSVSSNVDATRLVDIYKRLKNVSEVKITINDLIIYALSRVALEFKEVNSVTNEDSYDTFNYVSVSLAVDRGEGLFVPVIKYASEMTLSEIALASKNLINKVITKTLTPQDSSGGTITISNVGPTGVKMFTPILNWPQSTILGVGSITDEVKLKDGNFISYPQITLSLTFNHNTYDGALAAKFILKLQQTLENLDLLFIK